MRRPGQVSQVGGAGRAEVRGGLEAGLSLIAAWRTNNRVTMYLIESLPPELWSRAVPGVPRRTVRMIAAHIHNVRCMWIKMMGARDGIAIPRTVDPRRVRPPELLRALSRSSDGIVRLLELGISRGGVVPRAAWQNFPTDLAHFLSYFVAHEGHHRGQLCMLARQVGQRLPGSVTAGLWQWTRRARE
jgi:uncharacterized damage-inducible protein DinB